MALILFCGSSMVGECSMFKRERERERASKVSLHYSVDARHLFSLEGIVWLICQFLFYFL